MSQTSVFLFLLVFVPSATYAAAPSEDKPAAVVVRRALLKKKPSPKPKVMTVYIDSSVSWFADNTENAEAKITAFIKEVAGTNLTTAPRARVYSKQSP